MNSTLYTNVISNIKWNAIESVIYSALMIAHQAALFKILDINQYGLIGSIFSYIFFSELTLCLGLNNSTGSFFSVWSESQKKFRLFFGWNMAVNYIASLLYFAVGYWTIGFITGSTYALVALIILFEKTKQICKTILHILFKSRLKSFIELASFIIFLMMVWIQYWAGYPLTVMRLIIPFLITSGISSSVFIFVIIQWYNQLPSHDQALIERPLIIRIIKNRFFAITHKTSKRFFSSNFLIPMVATRFGMKEAGILKITTQVAYYTTLILRKAFGNASTAFFAHTKNTPFSESDINVQWIIRFLRYATIGIIAVATITATLLTWIMPDTFTLAIALLIIASFSNAAIMNGITTLEQWFIIHEKTTVLMSAQLLVTSVWIAVLWHDTTFSPLHLLTIATICNILLFITFNSIIIIHQNQSTTHSK